MTVPRPLWKGAGGPPCRPGDVIRFTDPCEETFRVRGWPVWRADWNRWWAPVVREFDLLRGHTDPDGARHLGRPRIYPTGGFGHRAPTGTR